MPKTDVIKRVAKETRLSQRVIADVLGASQRLIEATLRAGEPVTFSGFDTFYARKWQEGKVRHIRTGRTVSVRPAASPGSAWGTSSSGPWPASGGASDAIDLPEEGITVGGPLDFGPSGPWRATEPRVRTGRGGNFGPFARGPRATRPIFCA